jgi:hypothetical protein
MVSVMSELAENCDSCSPKDPPKELAAVVARVRWLMIVSGLTTAVAIAAVVGVIGYRIYAGRESGPHTMTAGTVILPKGAHVTSAAIGDGRIAVTLDIAGASEVRIFDLNTLQQTGQLHFATEP